MASAHLTPSGSSLSMLLSLYMQGQITEQQWKRMMKLFDSGSATKTERMALARYVRDVVTESGAASLDMMPKPRELNDVLGYVRHS